MDLRRTTLILLMVLSASFAGGAFSHWMLTGRSASAQQTGNPKFVRTVTLYLVDESTDQVRGTLTIDAGGKASLSLRDDEGADCLALDVSADGTPTVSLLGAGSSRADIAIEGGEASVDLAGPSGGLTMSLQDGPHIELTAPSGQTMARLAIVNGQASFVMFDSAGEIVWQAPPVAGEDDE